MKFVLKLIFSLILFVSTYYVFESNIERELGIFIGMFCIFIIFLTPIKFSSPSMSQSYLDRIQKHRSLLKELEEERIEEKMSFERKFSQKKQEELGKSKSKINT